MQPYALAKALVISGVLICCFGVLRPHLKEDRTLAALERIQRENYEKSLKQNEEWRSQPKPKKHPAVSSNAVREGTSMDRVEAALADLRDSAKTFDASMAKASSALQRLASNLAAEDEARSVLHRRVIEMNQVEAREAEQREIEIQNLRALGFSESEIQRK